MAIKTKALVLNHIWNTPGAHRKQIAAHYRLHPNLVSDAVRDLIGERWVIEGESKTSSAGRAPIALYLDNRNRAALAVAYAHNSMTCGLINAAGEVIQSKTVSHRLRRPDEIIHLADEQIAKLRRGYKGTIIGLGVADPGMIDQRKGEVIRSSSFPDWRNVGIARLFKAKTGLNVAVVDITHARAIGQYRVLAGRCRNPNAMLYVDYAAGVIGFALLTPHGIWRGNGFAGEVGHVVMDPQGPLCRCGARGCLESMANSQALEKNAAALLGKNIHSALRKYARPGGSDIFRAAKGGDRFARTIIHDVVHNLGFCVAIIVAMLHPHFIVVGAETEDAIGLLADEIRAAINTRVLPEISSAIEVIEGRPVNDLSLTGAGLMMFERAIQEEDGKKRRNKIERKRNEQEKDDIGL